VIQVVQYL